MKGGLIVSDGVSLVTVGDKDLGTVFQIICYCEFNFNVFILDMPEYYVYEVLCSYSNFKANDLYCSSKHNDYFIDLHQIGKCTYLLEWLLYRPVT